MNAIVAFVLRLAAVEAVRFDRGVYLALWPLDGCCCVACDLLHTADEIDP